MSCTPDESLFLAWLADTLNSKKAIEVGVFMGMTTMSLAKVMKKNHGKVGSNPACVPLTLALD
jgi:predicted O-methyltransferase YrrM